jgi:hypothetical protein
MTVQSSAGVILLNLGQPRSTGELRCRIQVE